MRIPALLRTRASPQAIFLGRKYVMSSNATDGTVALTCFTQSDSRPKYGPISRRMLSPSGSVQLWHDSDFRIKQSLYAVAERSKRAKKKHRFDLPSLFWSNHHELRVNSYNLYDKVLVDAECK